MGRHLTDVEKTEIGCALLSGLGISEVARRYSLPKQTVHRIKQGLGPRVEQANEIRRESMDELLVKAMVANLDAQHAIAEVATDAEYLRSQNALGIAALYQRLSDHSIRLFEAASADDGGTADGTADLSAMAETDPAADMDG